MFVEYPSSMIGNGILEIQVDLSVPQISVNLDLHEFLSSSHQTWV